MLRGFKDSAGVEWRVWEVFPSNVAIPPRVGSRARSSLTATPFANGWLCFESGSEKRRLAPIPAGWAFNEPLNLEALCRQATVIPPRRRRAVLG